MAGLTRKFVSKNVDVSRGAQKLGLTYRPLSETMLDMFEYMVSNHYFE